MTAVAGMYMFVVIVSCACSMSWMRSKDENGIRLQLDPA